MQQAALPRGDVRESGGNAGSELFVSHAAEFDDDFPYCLSHTSHMDISMGSGHLMKLV